jgi:hypothetical protein
LYLKLFLYLPQNPYFSSEGFWAYDSNIEFYFYILVSFLIFKNIGMTSSLDYLDFNSIFSYVYSYFDRFVGWFEVVNIIS